MKKNADILYKTCDSHKELTWILHLQKINHFTTLPDEERKAKGFLTCIHTNEILAKWNRIAPHIIAVKDGKVIGYLLTMTSEASLDMPILQPMFQVFEELHYQEKAISKYNYLVVGQVCVAKEFRGAGVLEKLYELYGRAYSEKFDFAITEIAVKNKRSIHAHIKNGFEKLLIYETTECGEWCIVILDWNKKNRVA